MTKSLFHKAGFSMWLELSFLIYKALMGKCKWSRVWGLFNCTYSGFLYRPSVRLLRYNTISYIEILWFNNCPPFIIVCAYHLAATRGNFRIRKFLLQALTFVYFWRWLKWIKDNMKINTLAASDRNEICFVLKGNNWGRSLQLMISTWKCSTLG